MIRICLENGRGKNCFCLSTSTSRWPRLSCAWVALSRSLPNCAKAASSRYCANSSFKLPATCRIALICALPRTPQQQRNLTVRCSVLRKVVVNHQRVPFVLAEVLGRCRRELGRRVLHRG